MAILTFFITKKRIEMVNIGGVFLFYNKSSENHSCRLRGTTWWYFLPFYSSRLFFSQTGWKILPGVGNTGKDGPTEAGAADDAGLGTVFRPVLHVLGRDTHEVVGDPVHHRKIRQRESNAIYRNLKNWPVKGLCGRCFICLRPPPLLWPHTPFPLTQCTRV